MTTCSSTIQHVPHSQGKRLGHAHWRMPRCPPCGVTMEQVFVNSRDSLLSLPSGRPHLNRNVTYDTIPGEAVEPRRTRWPILYQQLGCIYMLFCPRESLWTWPTGGAETTCSRSTSSRVMYCPRGSLSTTANWRTSR